MRFEGEVICILTPRVPDAISQNIKISSHGVYPGEAAFN